jgi:predicted permease
MGVAAGELIVPFTGAIQAAFSVLLTIAFGVVAAQCNLLSPNAAKEVSKLCVRMFLPALLIYKIGSNLHQDTGVRYVPVLRKYSPRNYPQMPAHQSH